MYKKKVEEVEGWEEKNTDWKERGNKNMDGHDGIGSQYYFKNEEHNIT